MKFGDGRPYQYLCGHRVFYDEEAKKLTYEDGTEVETTPRRPCAKCGLPPTAEGHDPCIANLHGVIAACCGHGVQNAYAWDGQNRYEAETPEALIALVKFLQPGPCPTRGRKGVDRMTLRIQIGPQGHRVLVSRGAKDK
jgi:hypothetical protein